MPLNPSRRCSDCRNNGGNASSGSTSSSSTSLSSDGGPLVVSSDMVTSGRRKTRRQRAISSSSSSSSSVTTAASSTSGNAIPNSLMPGQQSLRPLRQDAFAWQLPDQSRHVPRARSYMQPQGPYEESYIQRQVVHEDRVRNNTAADTFQWGQGSGRQGMPTEDNRIRNRNYHSTSNSYLPPGPALPRSYVPTPYPLSPPFVLPQGFHGAIPDEGELATCRRYNQRETPDYIRLQAIFKEWEDQVRRGLIPELNEHKHLWSSFVKRFHSDPPVLDMNAEVQRHKERLERESTENLKAAARRSKKTLDELARIDRSRKAYHGNPNIRAPKPKHPIPEQAVPKPRL